MKSEGEIWEEREDREVGIRGIEGKGREEGTGREKDREGLR